MNTPLIEGCVASVPSAAAACRAGADRLELSSNLAIGGTTASPALFRQVQKISTAKINALIRPRFGDFLYSEDELEEMADAVKTFRDLGANGVVFGVLTPDGRLDVDAMGRLMDCAGDMEVTLHRAFDLTRDPFEALETAISLGCRTILTSGQAPTAMEGAQLLAELVRRADGRIDIMAGSGVRRDNIAALHEKTGTRVFHTSCRAISDSGMVYRKEGVPMGLPFLSEYEVWGTDEGAFAACARVVHGLA